MLVNPCNLGQRFENSGIGLLYKSENNEHLYRAEDLDFQKIEKVFYYQRDYLFLSKEGEVYYGNKKIQSLEDKKIIDISVCALSESVLFLDVNGKVYGWGENICGQLGFGDFKNREMPELIEELNEEEVIQIKMGWKSSLALTKDGKVYSWGKNHVGQLGHGNIKKQHAPKQIKALDGKKIVQISVGYFHCFALSDNGKVYSWGSNQNGILGHGFEDYKRHEIPSLALSLKELNIVQIASGPYHSLALTDSGDVLSWGANWEGQLGLGHKKIVVKPQVIDFFKDKKVTKLIEIMTHCSIVLVDNDKLYVWGLNSSGQLGFDDRINRCRPEYIEIRPKNLY